MIWKVLGGLRILAALTLLAIAAYTGWLSTMLLDMSNFRTEGSPAGTLMFVVLLTFPFVSIGALLAGIFLLTVRPRKFETFMSAAKPPPAEVFARRGVATDGSTMELVVHGELAALWCLRPDGSGERSNNPQPNGGVTYHAFRSVDGQPLRLPRHWLVSSPLAKRALEDFEHQRDWKIRLNSAETPVLPEHLAGDSDRARWEWLVMTDSSQ